VVWPALTCTNCPGNRSILATAYRGNRATCKEGVKEQEWVLANCYALCALSSVMGAVPSNMPYQAAFRCPAVLDVNSL
jgi:hypothetical protein